MTAFQHQSGETNGRAVALVEIAPGHLPALVDRAAATLLNARTSAEVLAAREIAAGAYDDARRLGRLARKKQAHDEVVAAVYRSQADALAIESEAKRRLADEYDAAQERGEIRTQRDNGAFSKEEKASAADIGLTPKQVHDARMIRDAEEADPGVVRRTVDEAVAAGEEPTRAKVKRATVDAKKKGGGARIGAAVGKTPEQICREGLRMQEDGATAQEAAKALSIHASTYRRMRDVVLLADRDDLSERDHGAAQAALAEMNERGQVAAAHTKIAALAERVWGAPEARSASRERTEQIRMNAFERAYGVLIQACTCAEEIELPHLGADRAREILRELKRAEKSVSALRRRIEEIYQ